jgi:hypothetical protein
MVIVCPIDIGPEGYFSWIPLVLLIFTIVYLILALGFMLAKFFQKPEYESRIKVEFSRQLVSVIFIAIILGFSSVLCTASATITGDVNPFDTAMEFVSEIGLVSIPKNVNVVWESSINARKLSTIMLGIPSCMTGVCYTPFLVGNYVSYHLDMLGMIIMPFSASMIVQILFLDFIQKYFLALLLPAGFLLKVNPVTRDAGAFLISLALAFYFIFPMLYLMGSLIHQEVSDNIIYNIKSTIKDFKEANILLESQKSAYEFDNNNSLKAIGELAYYSMIAFTTPMLSVVITIAGARALFPVFSKDFIGMVDM